MADKTRQTAGTVTLEDIAARLDAIEKKLSERQNEDVVALNVKQVAQKLNISKDTAYSWVHSGFIPHIKKGGRIVVSLGALRRWADEQSEKRLEVS